MQLLHLDQTIFDLEKLTQSTYLPAEHGERELVLSFLDGSCLMFTGEQAEQLWQTLQAQALTLTPQPKTV